MNVSHVPMLAPYTKHVEEHGLGRHVTYTDIACLIRRPEEEDKEAFEAWEPHALRYIDISDMAPNEIDFSVLFGRTTNALDEATLPLEVIEVQQRVYDSFVNREGMFRKRGWVPKEAGRRGWLVKDFGNAKDHDDGSRSWKMGATYWGIASSLLTPSSSLLCCL